MKLPRLLPFLALSTAPLLAQTPRPSPAASTPVAPVETVIEASSAEIWTNEAGTETYAIFMVRFRRDATMDEVKLRELVQSTGFSAYNPTYRLHGDVGQFEYRMVLRTMDATNARTLSEKLRADPSVLEFRIAPTGD